jgi:hypothetical protein
MSDLSPRSKPTVRPDKVPLEALRLLLNQQAISLSPLLHQINTPPQEPELEYYFIPMTYMNEFAPYHRPGKPFKNLKLVNYERPAISLSFTSKHKYSIKRQPAVNDMLLHLQNYRDELLNRSYFQSLGVDQTDELRRVDTILRTLRLDPRAFEGCFSNYHHYYRYWYCTYRFFDDATLLTTSTVNEHLLKHTERVQGQVHERLNIIFVDPVYISRPVPHDNKRVDRELDTFPLQFRQGTVTLYLRNNHF